MFDVTIDLKYCTVGPIATRQNLRFLISISRNLSRIFARISRSEICRGPWPWVVAGESDLSKSSQAIALVLESGGFKEAMNLSCYY